MQEFKIKVDSFKKMTNPSFGDRKRVKYVCYAQANTLDRDLSDWMETNPREQKMTTNTAKKIKESLEDNSNFHELNNGILFSASSVVYDNRTQEAIITFEDPQKHGNIDGGHTLRAILDVKSSSMLSDNRFVFIEIMTGIDSPVELAAARNTMVPVDLKSIEELKKSFEIIKEIMSETDFENRIAYKMNEHYSSDINPIDVREIIAILNMFNQSIYSKRNSQGILASHHPVQSYSGKESSLKKFTNQKKPNREKVLKNMQPIVNDIFLLWNLIETDFPKKAAVANKKYGTRSYSKYNDGTVVGKTFFYNDDIKYLVPKGLMYPIIGAFRALVEIDDDGKYSWKANPIDVWEKIGDKLSAIILEEKTVNPDVIAKTANLWGNLFKEVYIHGYMQ